jgi:Fanconi anemia group M protein
MKHHADGSSPSSSQDPELPTKGPRPSPISASGPGPGPGPIPIPIPIPIAVDDREVGEPVCEILRTRPEFAVEVRRLAVGDYLVGSRLCVERKTAADFVASVIDRRLFQQAARLSAWPDPSCLILEGSGHDLTSLGMSREAIQGALISLGLVFNVPVLRSVNAEETVRLMLHGWRQLSRQQCDAVSRGGCRPKRRRRAQLHALQALPSVGPKRAVQLLDRFGSVRGVINASADALMELPGISEKTVEAIEWLVR